MNALTAVSSAPAQPPLNALAREFALTNWRIAEKLRLLVRASETHFSREPGSIEPAHIERLEAIEQQLATALMDAKVLKGGAA